MMMMMFYSMALLWLHSLFTIWRVVVRVLTFIACSLYSFILK